MPVDIETFVYPLPAEEAQKIIKDHDDEWIEYWTKTNHNGYNKRPKDNPKYMQAYVETLYGPNTVIGNPYTEFDFVEEMKRERINNEDGDLDQKFIWDFITMKAEKIACKVNQVWVSYGALFLDRSWGAKFSQGYLYNYYKAIACGKDPKSAYYFGVARAMDGIL